MDSYDLAEYNDLRSQIRDTKGSLDQTLLAGFPSVAAVWTLAIGLTNGFQHVYWPLFLAAAFIALFFYHFALTQDYQILRLATYIRVVHEHKPNEATSGEKRRRAPYWETFLYDIRVKQHEPSAIPIHPASAVGVFVWFTCCSSGLTVASAVIDPIYLLFGTSIRGAVGSNLAWIEVLIAITLALVPMYFLVAIRRSLKRDFNAYESCMRTFADKAIGIKELEESPGTPIPM